MSAAALRYPRIYLTFHGDTRDLLRPAPEREQLLYPLNRRTSLKDIIEGLGVPHTEVGSIRLDGHQQSFEKIPCDGEYYEILPLSPAEPPTVPTFLRPEPLSACMFMVDINVARLAGLLRMAGIDAETVDPGWTAEQVVRSSVRQHRILLTRNRELLRHRIMVFGRLVRSEKPDEQLAEIIRLYGLRDRLAPFSRCITCNGLLAEVDKANILDRLQPLTRKYFERFKACRGCGKIYWHGSHHQQMRERLSRILKA
jgi:uncharacterized protein with PIN domain